jgi:CRISPR-associated protein Csb3
MAETTIPVDLLNPGQVFACLGLMESAEILVGNAAGCFDWSDDANVRFRLRADGEQNPVQTVLHFLAHAEVHSQAPERCDLSTQVTWQVPTTSLPDGTPFPYPVPESPATLPATLSDGGRVIPLNYWADGFSITSRDNAKFWAGAGGYPGAALARDALSLVRDRISQAVPDPFNLSAEQSSSFRFDWRRDYVPLDIGFSINNHAESRFATVGFPLVEILAAIGLTHARPEFITKLDYRYGVLGLDASSRLFDLCFMRASLGAASLPFHLRTFRMQLGWPGKSGQARCITTVFEE